MEWKFVISHYYTGEIFADSTNCYNATYNTNKEALNWANTFDKDLAELLQKDEQYSFKVLGIERGNEKPRKKKTIRNVHKKKTK